MKSQNIQPKKGEMDKETENNAKLVENRIADQKQDTQNT